MKSIELLPRIRLSLRVYLAIALAGFAGGLTIGACGSPGDSGPSFPGRLQAAGGCGAVGGAPCNAGAAPGLCNTNVNPSMCVPFDPTIIVTDTAVLNAVDAHGVPIFSLQAVLQQLINKAGAAAFPLTPQQLFNQWWDDENPSTAANLRPPCLVNADCQGVDTCNANHHCVPAISARYPHCDDAIDAAAPKNVFPLKNGAPADLLNGFPIQCARPEGFQSTTNPFPAGGGQNADSYVPIALVNRFDLAPQNGENCGEYRIIFAKKSGQTINGERNLIIFEAVEPNVNWQQGLAGCNYLEQMWQRLGTAGLPLTAPAGQGLELPGGPESVAGDLRQFFFDGWTGGGNWDPVVLPSHYGATLNVNNGCSTGQIRTDQFITDGIPAGNPDGDGWTLREFKLVEDCRCVNNQEECPLVVVPVSVKQNPFGDLFNSGSNIFAQVPKLPSGNFETAAQFIGQADNGAALASNHPLLIPWAAPVPLLPANTSFTYTLAPDADNAGESESQVKPNQQSNDYPSPIPPAGGDLDPGFTAALLHAAPPIPGGLTPAQIVSRARALSCAGCHEFSANVGFAQALGGGLVWQPSLGFTHVSEQLPGGALNFPISPALTNLFLPNRLTILEDYLANLPPAVAAPNHCPLPLAASLQINNCALKPAQIFDPVGLRQMEPPLQPPISPIVL